VATIPAGCRGNLGTEAERPTGLNIDSWLLFLVVDLLSFLRLVFSDDVTKGSGAHQYPDPDGPGGTCLPYRHPHPGTKGARITLGTSGTWPKDKGIMLRSLGHLWLRQRVLLVLFVLALGLTGFFVVRLVVVGIHWSNPAHHDAVIEGWMPLRYVARSWDVPPEVLGAALGLRAVARLTVADIAAARGSTVEAVRADLLEAIHLWRSAPPVDPGDDD
jgi:hypothetical protein